MNRPLALYYAVAGLAVAGALLVFISATTGLLRPDAAAPPQTLDEPQLAREPAEPPTTPTATPVDARRVAEVTPGESSERRTRRRHDHDDDHARSKTKRHHREATSSREDDDD